MCAENIKELNRVFWTNMRTWWHFWENAAELEFNEWSMKEKGCSSLQRKRYLYHLWKPQEGKAALKIGWGPLEYNTHLFSCKILERWISLQLRTKAEEQVPQKQSAGLPDQANDPAWKTSLCTVMGLEQSGRRAHWQEAGLGPEVPVPAGYQPENFLQPGAVLGRSLQWHTTMALKMTIVYF